MAKLTKEKVKNFRSDFDSMSKLFEAKYGLRLALGTIRFDETSLRATLTALAADPVGEAARSVNTEVAVIGDAAPRTPSTDSEGNWVLMNARAAGITLELSPKGFVGSTYRLPGKRYTYTVTGVNRRAPKYMVEVVTSSGTRYRMPVTALRAAVLVAHA